MSLSPIEWELDFHCRHWQESPAPTTDICCLTLVNNSHINHVTLPAFYVQAFLLHSSKPNHLQATTTYRLVNLGLRSTSSLGLSPKEVNYLSLGFHSPEITYRMDHGVGLHLIVIGANNPGALYLVGPELCLPTPGIIQPVES